MLRQSAVTAAQKLNERQYVIMLWCIVRICCVMSVGYQSYKQCTLLKVRNHQSSGHCQEANGDTHRQYQVSNIFISLIREPNVAVCACVIFTLIIMVQIQENTISLQDCLSSVASHRSSWPLKSFIHVDHQMAWHSPSHSQISITLHNQV